MGLSVISTPRQCQPQSSASPVATALAEGLPGEFAALLSGELKALLTAAQTYPGPESAMGPEATLGTTADSASDAPNRER
jgi:hypothetical protein